jgi:L-fuculokinase
MIGVFDIGKTNAKFALLEPNTGAVLEQHSTPNTVLYQAPYPHVDTEALWDWMLLQLRQTRVKPTALMVVAHGATAALVKNGKLSLPILDYETPLEAHDYPRPPFLETASPELPGGLNLGRQLYWLEQHFPDEFVGSTILLYPQYWAWRFSGVFASEVSSLGCHTDLWATSQTFSSLGQRYGAQFPPLRKAWEVLGNFLPDMVAELGFDCQIHCGVHDSNASLVPYLNSPNVSVVSTGTWSISMVIGGNTDGILDSRDTLCNSNVLGQPVPTARFMGGRDYAEIVQNNPMYSNWATVQTVIESAEIVLPDLSVHSNRTEQRIALASLYCALRIDQQLGWLGSSADIVLEGSFAQNPLIVGLLAALRPAQRVLLGSSGTLEGAFLLVRWQDSITRVALQQVAPAAVTGLLEYKKRWLEVWGSV